jgi:hypothetical protein
LSVVGFDDLLPAPWMIPPLTTVRQPLTEMAVAAATMVVALARHEVLASNRLELSTTLVVRSSTALPHQASVERLASRADPDDRSRLCRAVNALQGVLAPVGAGLAAGAAAGAQDFARPPSSSSVTTFNPDMDPPAAATH